jgi:hypothetical protein
MSRSRYDWNYSLAQRSATALSLVRVLRWSRARRKLLSSPPQELALLRNGTLFNCTQRTLEAGGPWLELLPATAEGVRYRQLSQAQSPCSNHTQNLGLTGISERVGGGAGSGAGSGAGAGAGAVKAILLKWTATGAIGGRSIRRRADV